MKARAVGLAGVVGAVASVALFASGALPANQPANCKRISLEPPPAWSNSAAWSSDGREVTIVDVLGGDLLRYSEGKYFGSIARPGLGDLEFDHPTHLTTIAAGFLLENPPGKVIWLDPSYRSVKSVDFLKAKKSSHIKEEIITFGLKEPQLSGNQLVGFAIVHRNGRPWQGFVRMTLQPFELAEMIEEIKPDSLEDRLFRLQGEAIALAAGSQYGLRYAQPTFLLELAPAKRRLKAFPLGFESLPSLPESPGGPSAAPVLYKALERSTAAMRLYGRGDFLYLLTRKPASQGTLWQLWQIDPRRDVVMRSLTLPTTANHVFLAPGLKEWAVIEKGPVKESGRQEIRNMLLIPSSWIEDSASKVLVDGNSVACR